MNKLLFGGVVVLALIVGVIYLAMVLGEGREGNLDASPMADDMREMEDDSSGSQEPVDMGEPDVTFVLTGENFKFVKDGADNPELRVKYGEVVRVEFISTQGFHDWVVDEFGAATSKVRPENGMTYVEFVADEVGTFEYYCSVGEHRANGMWGRLIVSD